VLFTEPRPLRTRYDLAHLPGVLRVEPFRATPARLRFGPRTYRIALTGLEPGAQLRRLLDRFERETPIPPSGLVLSKGLGDILRLTLGDTVLVEVLEGTRPSRLLVVTGLVDDLIGVSALMDAGALSRLLGEEGAMSGAYLSVDPVQAAALYVQLKQMPAVASVSVRETDLANFEKTLAESSRISSRVLVVFAIVIAVGMVYNGSRIALSERARELASLRVLGFTRREVSTMLLGEQAILTVIAIPVGLVLGFGLYALIAVVFSSELFRMPLVISNATYLFAVLVMVVAAVLSAAVVRRRVDRLDLVAVLKTRE
jgi:putative ABC transport system permease protein